MMRLFLVALTGLMAVPAFADQLILSAESLYELPRIGNPAVEVLHAHPSLLAVQPAANLHFTFASCSEDLPLRAEVQNVGKVVFVKVHVNYGGECRGMPVDRNYSLQISSDFDLESQVVVLNPTNQTWR